MFDCQAEDEDHAREQCENAYPESYVMRVVRMHSLKRDHERQMLYDTLAVGDEVFWLDPHLGLSSEIGVVSRIDDYGQKVDQDTLVLVSFPSGGEAEVVASELH